MKLINFIHVFGIAILMMSCGNDDGDCSGELVCDLEFRTILVDVRDSEGNPVIFDEFTVTNLQTNEAIEFEWEAGDRYPVADDSMRSELPTEGHQIELVGILNGEEVLRQTYLVGHDCCHVILLDGDTTIQL